MVTLTFITTSLFLLLTPGPTNTLLAAYGAAFGMRRGAALVLAEAAGYAAAVTFFALIAQWVTHMPAGLVVVKTIAAAWLLFSAVQLWRARNADAAEAPRCAFARVLLTTILNPKAMVIGVVLIPPGTGANLPVWIATYIALSMTAGLLWILGGSLLPRRLKQHAYQGAALVLGGFSLVAIASAAA
jgi:threonine/homoserine/homoserine lactone efflux protein